MNRKLINEKLVPLRVLTLWGQKKEYGHSSYYIESRDVKMKGGKAELSAPQPLPESTMKDIAMSFMSSTRAEMRHETLVGDHLLHCSHNPGNTTVMWWRPAQQKKLNFERTLVAGNKPVKIPATLYVVVNNSLYVYALADDSRPVPKTKLYNAPFFNIYADGKVCLGTAPVGKKQAETFEGEALRFERGFYLAEQSGGQSEHSCKTNLRKLWPALMKSGRAFPKSELKPHAKYKTLQQLIEGLIGKAKGSIPYEVLTDVYVDDDEFDNENED